MTCTGANMQEYWRKKKGLTKGEYKELQEQKKKSKKKVGEPKIEDKPKAETPEIEIFLGNKKPTKNKNSKILYLDLVKNGSSRIELSIPREYGKYFRYTSGKVKKEILARVLK